MPDLLRSVLSFLVVLGVLVFVHELGHYLAARWRGVKVDAFSIGFGRPIATWTDRHGTVWKLAWLPLGGYVKLHGQERPQDVPDDVRAGWLPGQTFHDKSVASRAIVVAAGPAANFVLPVVLFTALFAFIGQPVTLPVVQTVLPHSAAAAAGLRHGDRIRAVDGQNIADFQALQKIIEAHPAAHLTLTVRRDGKTVSLPVLTEAATLGGRRVGRLGVAGGLVAYRPMAPQAAVGRAFTETWDVTAQTARGVAQIIAGDRGTKDLGGPLRIAQLSGQVAELGLPSLLSFIAVLSVNIGMINLLPIPVLDGGHLLFFLFEAIRGRPLPPRAQEYGIRAGLALIAGLFVFATWNDLVHLGLFHWLVG
ncbi:MAG: RIP metalloprotease RseP [Rhodospirillales bacterium]|nr:RIP metalloprotease RseP [Rhodospirillales bacterium]